MDKTPERPEPIRVKDPLSGRFLFSFDPEALVVSVVHRGIVSDVDLRRLARDPADRAAVASRPEARKA